MAPSVYAVLTIALAAMGAVTTVLVVEARTVRRAVKARTARRRHPRAAQRAGRRPGNALR